MKPGDRIELLKRLASRLSERDGREINLTLRQFGLPWSDLWEDDPYGYTLHHLEEANDPILLGLYEYLFSGEELPATSVVTTEGPWEPNRFRLFLSHISNDRALAGELKGCLDSVAIDTFVAHEDIEPTKEWVKEVETALDTCHALAALLTTQFHVSTWTDQEVGYCIKRRVLIVPVMIGVVPYGFMSRYQGLQTRGKQVSDIAAEVFSVLMEHDLSSGQMASALLSYLEGSPSFDETRRRMTLVQGVKRWTPDLLQRLEGSIERNGQIKDCWHVPDQIRTLVERHSGQEPR